MVGPGVDDPAGRIADVGKMRLQGQRPRHHDVTLEIDVGSGTLDLRQLLHGERRAGAEDFAKRAERRAGRLPREGHDGLAHRVDDRPLHPRQRRADVGRRFAFGRHETLHRPDGHGAVLDELLRNPLNVGDRQQIAFLEMSREMVVETAPVDVHDDLLRRPESLDLQPIDDRHRRSAGRKRRFNQSDAVGREVDRKRRRVG